MLSLWVSEYAPRVIEVYFYYRQYDMVFFSFLKAVWLPIIAYLHFILTLVDICLIGNHILSYWQSFTTSTYIFVKLYISALLLNERVWYNYNIIYIFTYLWISSVWIYNTDFYPYRIILFQFFGKVSVFS